MQFSLISGRFWCVEFRFAQHWFSPLLQKLGFGKLPGDLRFRLFGREWFVPLTSTILLSLVVSMIAKFI